AGRDRQPLLGGAAGDWPEAEAGRDEDEQETGEDAGAARERSHQNDCAREARRDDEDLDRAKRTDQAAALERAEAVAARFLVGHRLLLLTRWSRGAPLRRRVVFAWRSRTRRLLIRLGPDARLRPFRRCARGGGSRRWRVRRAAGAVRWCVGAGARGLAGFASLAGRA